ncbi:MAG: rhodanese-like domain-containing protein [Flavobacterium sp.]
MEHLSQSEWIEGAKQAYSVILDVRTQEEWDKGYILGAQLNDIYTGQAFIYRLEDFDKSKNYYVYCHAGGRSAKACQIMEQLGFPNTYNLIGGISEWEGPLENDN